MGHLTVLQNAAPSLQGITDLITERNFEFCKAKWVPGRACIDIQDLSFAYPRVSASLCATHHTYKKCWKPLPEHKRMTLLYLVLEADPASRSRMTNQQDKSLSAV